MDEKYWNFQAYKGYVLLKRDGHWQAVLNSETWFTGKTVAEVRQKIDDALAEIPDPVY